MKQVHVGHTKLHLPHPIHLSLYSFHIFELNTLVEILSGMLTLIVFSLTKSGVTFSS
ncbi:hypothetical protein Q604_UNBC16338G0002, partial [human gut metagenome]